MARRKIKAGSTSVTLPVFVQDTSSTVGAGLGGLAFNTSGLAAKYRREGQSSWQAIALATATVGTWAAGGFVADGGQVAGGYELGLPDAALAAGAKWVQVALYGAANMLAVLIEVELDAVDYQDATNFGLANLSLLGSNYTAIRAAYLDNLNVGGVVAKESGGNLTAVKGKTDNLPATPAATGDAMALTVAAGAQVADKLLGRSLAGGADGGRTVRDALRFLRNKWAIVGSTLTVYQEDDASTAWVSSITVAAGDPVTASDPV